MARRMLGTSSAAYGAVLPAVWWTTMARTSGMTLGPVLHCHPISLVAHALRGRMKEAVWVAVAPVAALARTRRIACDASSTPRRQTDRKRVLQGKRVYVSV